MAPFFVTQQLANRVVQILAVALAITHGQQLTTQPYVIREILGLLVALSAVTALTVGIREKVGQWAIAQWLTEVLGIVTQYIGVIVVMCLNRWVRDWLAEESWGYITAFRYLPLFFLLAAATQGFAHFFYTPLDLPPPASEKRRGGAIEER